MWVVAIQILAVVALIVRAFRRSERVTMVVRIALVALAIAAFALADGRHVKEFFRSPYGKVDTWGIFHYYLGAKYFNELTYVSLYACSAAAYREAGGNLLPGVEVRDLATYDFVPQEELPACPRQRFSTARWAEFKEDVALLASLRGRQGLTYMLTDKGFNPPPFWAAIAGWLANRVPLGSAAAKFAFHLDLLFALLTLFIIARSCNLESASLAAIFMFLFVGNYAAITGNFLQYAWLPALVAALAWWREGAYVRSAVAWALATLLQAFPLVLTSIIGLQLISALTRRDPQNKWLPYGKFFGVYLLGLSIGLGIGSMSAYGMGAWADWATKIRLHGRYLTGELFDIGLRNLIATVISPDVKSIFYYLDAHRSVLVRIHAAEPVQWVWAVGLGAAVVLLWSRVARLSAQAVLSLGFVAVYAILNLSPFYYVSLVSIFAIWPVDDDRTGVFMQVLLLTLNVVQHLGHFSWMIWRDQLVSESLMASFFFLVTVASVRHRRRGSGGNQQRGIVPCQ
jgi:hypothetical protein